MLTNILQQKIYCTEKYAYKFSIALYNYRINNKLTQPDVANILGVNYRTIGNWERGLQLPRSQYTLGLSKLLDIHPIILADMLAAEFTEITADTALARFFTLMSQALGRNMHFDNKSDSYFSYNSDRPAMVKQCKLQFSLYENEVTTLLNQRYCEFDMTLERILECYNFANTKDTYTMKKTYNKLFNDDATTMEFDVIQKQLTIIKDTYGNHFKNVLRAYLNKNNLRISDVSDICDVDRACSCMWLDGSYFPRNNKAEAVCDMLGMHPLVLAVLRKNNASTRSTIALNVVVLTVLYSLFINLSEVVDIYNGGATKTRQQSYISSHVLKDVFGLSKEEIKTWRKIKAEDVNITVQHLYEIRNSVIQFLNKPAK